MSELKTVNIKGKEYVQVNERLKYFREKFSGYSLLSDVVSLDDKQVVIKAIIINDKGVAVANGIAKEINGDGMVNRTSYVENCETSAWGRALANFGIGIDNSVASADEVEQAIKMQELENELDEKTKELSKELQKTSDKVKNNLGEVVRGTVKQLISDIQDKINQGSVLNADDEKAYQWAVNNAMTMKKESEVKTINKLREILDGLRG